MVKIGTMPISFHAIILIGLLNHVKKNFLLKLRDFFRRDSGGGILSSADPVRDDVWDRSNVP